MPASRAHQHRPDSETRSGLLPYPAGARLQWLGVNAGAEQIYRSLLRQGGQSLEAIADQVGRRSQVVRAEVDTLVGLRLARITDDVVRVEAPEIAIGRLVKGHERRLQAEEEALSAIRTSIAQFTLDHRSNQDGDWDPVAIDAIESSDLVAIMEHLVDTSTGELRFMRPDQWALPSGLRMDRIVVEAVGRGRRSRVIYPDHLRTAIPEEVQQRADAGEQVRVLPEVPVRMAIFGDVAAILPEHFDRTEGRRLIIRHPALVRALSDLFDQHWSRGIAVPGLGEPVSTDVRRQLLEMLAIGAKDEQMARALGMSLRTVRRKVAALQGELGVQSRFQAGVEAVRRGWL